LTVKESDTSIHRSRNVVTSDKEFKFQLETRGNSKEQGPSHWSIIKRDGALTLTSSRGGVALPAREVFLSLLLVILRGEEGYLMP